MTYSEKPTTIKNEIALSLSERFRNSLSALGLSRDKHVFDLDFTYLSKSHDEEALGFIRLVESFYYSLDPLDRLVFQNDYLEIGRHHLYWWVPYFKQRDYADETRLMNDLVKKNLGGSLYGNQG